MQINKFQLPTENTKNELYPILLVPDSNAVVFLSNVGATPASYTRYEAVSAMVKRSDAEVAKFPIVFPSKERFMSELSSRRKGGEIIGANQKRRFAAGILGGDFTDDEISKFASGELVYSVFAFAIYDDVFGVTHCAAQYYFFDSSAEMRRDGFISQYNTGDPNYDWCVK